MTRTNTWADTDPHHNPRVIIGPPGNQLSVPAHLWCNSTHGHSLDRTHPYIDPRGKYAYACTRCGVMVHSTIYAPNVT